MKKNLFVYATAAILNIGLFSACIKNKPDVPADASTYDPGLTDASLKVTGNILGVKGLQTSGAGPVLITNDIVLSGIVTANDIAGNFYKQIMIQDSSSGIAVLIEKNGLFNDFPVGRKVYLRCKGLYIGDYGKFKQIGYALDEDNNIVGIPQALIGSVIVKANYPNAIPEKHLTLFQIRSNVDNEALLGTLITVDSNVEFAGNAIGLTYAQLPGLSSGTDRTLEECTSTSTVVMRNSGYAKFQGAPIPKGKGKLQAIFSRYNNTAQLLIRDLNDVKFTDSVRCDGLVFTPPSPMSIKVLRELYPDTSTNTIITLGNFQIHGVVTSSVADSNTNSNTIYMQDESGRGIMVYTISAHGYKMGDSLTIDLNGNQLIYYRGILELKKGTSSNLIITKVGANKTVQPKILTINQLNTDLSNPLFYERAYEAVLVRLNDVSLANAGGFLNGNTTVTDGAGNTIISFAYNRAPWKTTPIPTTSVDLVGIANVFANNSAPLNQIILRNPSSDIIP
jgi:hypothetical protein